MNDKFADLYHRAWTWAEFEDRYKDNPTYERRCVVALDLFSELIVRECVKVMDDMADPEDSERYFWAIQNAITKIQEHFGVRE